MRTYGIVRAKFWAWAKEKDLSPAARELALYCLTSPHTTGIGCFRLPIAYIAEDLGTVTDTVRDTVSELSQIGFLRHDESTGWIWLVGFLDHNPIANTNVGKSLVSFIESVPKKVPFYSDFLDALAKHDARFPNGYINGLRNGMPNGSGNGMPNHEHEHEHEHDDAPEGAGGDLLGGASDQSKSPAPCCAFKSFVEAARRHPRWPVPEELNIRRHKAIDRRIKDAGGLEGFMAVLAKAASSNFICNEMTGWSLDWFLKPANFAKVREGNYDNDRRGTAGRPVAAVSTPRAAWAENLP